MTPNTHSSIIYIVDASHRRPNIIVTSPANAALKPNDIFPGERIELLFHPIAPEELMKAVELTA